MSNDITEKTDKLLCRNCKCELTKDSSNSMWKYPYECAECDESFFEFELIKESE
jgi:hydrogenase maturation factor HypF (carbamoyltransferase family)